ncbi:hypothetical protein LIER_01061 [Lithospermum erythrorhizon]|uniref:Uncharacterized protein n=1 Tax=Lithospermum erythrorhizon TaxID=34254 RepID=A0AAV3NJL7_LITER
MKDLGRAKNILGMEIIRDRWLSQEKYILKVLARFNMESSKPISCPLGAHFKLSSKVSLEKKYDVEHMKNIPYASAVGSLMYAMLCTRPNLAYSFGLFSRTSLAQEVFQELGIRQSIIGLKKKLALIEKVHTNDNGADMCTKVLPKGKFDKCYSIAGLAVFPAATFH